ncbi:DUF2249 domain-containing protein [Deinococcus cellulosilyticus]|uniref:DUF2249 domain-containing protein n=1 Tax=Deinococcus cellulosilyticus (strain DSM 18568 / NBRC 106333 / KACC 11606 / 5516J-15) TaxID=1223518 RepID=A0A511MY51_DEIC1|nr:DUF2249 domain-containing protein [Deinococcus cellulosilyticus]GEM45524.1 hypothetical protein DC3_11590 [Deinococcus cellulosilyticus NBRC 106333 = KACC 11606]
MITAQTRISEVLQQHPELLPVLISASPAFEKLKNPMLRKVMPKLVTVQQAAGMAGLPVDDLLGKLLAALGHDASESQGVSVSGSLLGTPAPVWVDAVVAAELDVQPLLQRGEEPFSQIQKVAAAVPAGQKFLLLAPFEPVPLYQALGKKGFAAWCEHAGEFFRVHFYRGAAVQGFPEQEKPSSGSPANWTFNLEVTIPETLEPPEPMMRVLGALDQLQPGQALLVHHVRRPIYLLQRLEEMGHQVEVMEEGPRVEILIQKKPPQTSGSGTA